jgi:mannose-6-phosphate isomerase
MVQVKEGALFGSNARYALELRGVVQSYAWGKVGRSSRIASVIGSYGAGQPLAEYWIGTHPKAPSLVIGDGGAHLSLVDVLRDLASSLLGEAVATRYGNELPFLLKILSINPDFGLSIQAHPDLSRAQRLHARDPLNYPDARHKPEVALPLTTVTLLYGFRPLSEICTTFERFPGLYQLLDDELRQVVRDSNQHDTLHEAEIIERLYRRLLTSSVEEISKVVRALIQQGCSRVQDGNELDLVARLSRQYGDSDVGLVALFMMNLVKVEPGHALYIGPNVPHAYLDGDLVECMACSDNVVRAGLTPKYRDVETLLEMLDYTPRPAPILEPRVREDGFFGFDVPVEEFAISVLPDGSGPGRLVSGAAGKVLLTLGGKMAIRHTDSGHRLELSDGGAALIPPYTGEYILERSHAAVFVVSAL